MNYLDLLMLVQERGEKMLMQHSASLITDQHLYTRTNGEWTQNTEPGAPEQKWGKGGGYWIWKRTEPEKVDGDQ